MEFKKTIDIGGGYKLYLKVINQTAFMTSNYAKALREIYFKTKQEHPEKKLKYDYRKNIMIENFDIPFTEYINKIEEEILMAKEKQKEAIKDLDKEIKKNKNGNS